MEILPVKTVKRNLHKLCIGSACISWALYNGVGFGSYKSNSRHVTQVNYLQGKARINIICV